MQTATAQKEKGDTANLQEQVQAALKAVEEFDCDISTEIVNNLLTFDFGDETNKLLENAAEALANFWYDVAEKNLKQIPTNS